MAKNLDVEHVWTEIQNGYRIVEVGSHVVVLRHLTKEQKFQVNLLERIYSQKIGLTVFTEQQCFRFYEKKDIWTVAHEQRIKDLYAIIARMQKHEAQVGYRGTKTKKYKDELLLLIQKKEATKLFSIEAVKERFVDMIEMFFGCSFISTPLWSTLTEMLSSVFDPMFLSLLKQWIDFQTGFSVDIIRQIAVSNQVYAIWSSCSTKGVPFWGQTGGTDLDVNQRNLTFWLNTYSSAFENFGRPETLILEDNNKFDSWLEERIQDREKDTLKGFDSSKKGTRSEKRNFKIKP